LLDRRISRSLKESRVTNRNRKFGQLGLAVLVLVSLAGISGCNKGAGNTPEKDAGTALQISPEDVIKLSSNALTSGPSITGSVEAERRADLHAEVSAVVIAVLKENGDAVKRGDLLARLDQTAIRDTLTAAEASLTAASQAYEQGERQFQRMKKLRETGVVSTQQVEDVEVQRNSAQSDREAARTRVVAARQQLERTEVRAPFDGIVSNRKVSAGDTAAIGKELMQVIDPSSMRFEGRVSADNIGEVAAGQEVHFRVHGFTEQEFAGKVTRVNPSTNSTTRQVEVLVAFDDKSQQPSVAGLYAEGHIETRSSAALTLPTASLVREGDNAFAWRVKNGELQKVKLDLGARDARTGAYAVRNGLAEGDLVLRYPTSTLKDKQSARLSADAKPATLAAEEK
jgi:membrane fusion protein, multidrug efflux system